MISIVTEADLPDLLPLMRGYCDFYAVDPSDEALLAMSGELIRSPDRDGIQLIARDDARPGARLRDRVLDLVDSERLADRDHERPVRRPRRLAAPAPRRRSSTACAERSREHGATSLDWQTARDNERAQAVYERIGARRDERWVDYSLGV